MKARPNYMPPEQFTQVIDAIPLLKIRKWKDEDIQMLFKICYWCALRINEAMRLTVDDFDLDISEIWLGKTKASKGETAAIPERFKHEIQIWLIDKTGPLFPGLTYGTCIVWTRRLGEMLNIRAWVVKQSETGEKTRTHIFRKSIGKDMLYGEHGDKAPLTFISQTLRHKGKDPLGTTIKYLKVGTEDVKDWWKVQNEKDQIDLEK